VTRYFQRQDVRIDVINLRLSTVPSDDGLRHVGKVGPVSPWCLGGITMMALSDAVRAFSLAAEAPYKPGMRIMNAVNARAWVADPVADILRSWWGKDVDVSYFDRPENRFRSVYQCDRIREELGFVAQVMPAGL
jgi:nucleoside-diphosphate-sugar epimerase